MAEDRVTLLVGGDLALLVAADALDRAGRSVVWVTDARPPGGHVRGVRAGSHLFDVGMVLLELARDRGEATDPRDLRPEVRYDWTRFGGLVEDWLRERAELVRTPTPQVVLDRAAGVGGPDPLVADRLDLLAGLDCAPPVLDRHDPRHPAEKLRPGAYDSLLWDEASRLAHGADLHRTVVDPFAEKVLGPLRGSLLARHHRAAWLPLYWPGTVGAALAGQPHGLDEHPFWTVPGGAVAALVRGLADRVAASPRVRVVDQRVASLTREGGGWSLRTADGEVLRSDRPALGLPRPRARELAGLPAPAHVDDAAGVVAACLLVPGAAVGAPASCVNLVDPLVPAYRVTDQEVAAGRDGELHRVVVEGGADLAARAVRGEEVGPLLERAARDVLAVHPAAQVTTATVLVLPRAVPVPTASSVAAAGEDVAALAEALPGALRSNALLGVGVGSVADQVVQGLGIAAGLA